MAGEVRETDREGRRELVVALGDPKVFWAAIGVLVVSSAAAQLLDGWVRLVVTPVVVAVVAVLGSLALRRRQPPR